MEIKCHMLSLATVLIEHLRDFYNSILKYMLHTVSNLMTCLSEKEDFITSLVKINKKLMLAFILHVSHVNKKGKMHQIDFTLISVNVFDILISYGPAVTTLSLNGQ